jgi:diphosphomevalonate decarboxylase
MTTSTAQSHPNIALIKYWDDFDPCLRIPANSSLSMNLAGLESRTRVTFDTSLQVDLPWTYPQAYHKVDLLSPQGL